MKKTFSLTLILSILGIAIVLLFQNCSDMEGYKTISSAVLDNGNNSNNQNPPPPPPPPPPPSNNDPICQTQPNPTFPKFTNEPAQFRRVVDWGFDNLVDGGLHDNYPDPQKTSHFITECSDAPISPNYVLKSQRLAKGNGGGGIQLDYYDNKNTFNEMYVGLVWKANPDFVGGFSNRLFIFLAQEDLQGFVNWSKYEFKSLDEGFISFGSVTTNAASLPPNIKPNHVVSRNKWHLVEAIMKRSSAPGRKDGRIRWFVNGELVGDYMGYDSGGYPLNWVSYQQGWVDRAITREGPQANDWYYLADHIRISGI